MKKKLLNIIACLSLTAFVASCSPTEEVTPANEITSSNGLKVTLEWTTGASASQSIQEADLELILEKGDNEIRESDGVGFESLLVESIFADGEYDLVVEAYLVSKKADYTLYLTDGDGEQLKTYTGYFNAGDNNMKVDFLTIKKSGSKYIITEL